MPSATCMALLLLCRRLKQLAISVLLVRNWQCNGFALEMEGKGAKSALRAKLRKMARTFAKCLFCQPFLSLNHKPQPCTTTNVSFKKDKSFWYNVFAKWQTLKSVLQCVINYATTSKREIFFS